MTTSMSNYFSNVLTRLEMDRCTGKSSLRNWEEWGGQWRHFRAAKKVPPVVVRLEHCIVFWAHNYCWYFFNGPTMESVNEPLEPSDMASDLGKVLVKMKNKVEQR